MATAQNDTSSWVVPIHTAVQGRARLCVKGLYRNSVLQRTLEALLPDGVTIQSASANPLTGNLLVLFDADVPLATLVERIEDIVRGLGGAEAALANAAPAWHATEINQTLRVLDAPSGGLTSEVARDRMRRYGPNALPPIGARSRLAILAEQFQSSPVLLLAGAAALSIATGGILDAVVILGVVALNAGIGFITETNTERIIGSLRLPMQQSAIVRRDARRCSVPIADVVPGDLLILQPGAIVPADARIITTDALSIDESMLTGESQSVVKDPAPVAADRPMAERTSIVYRGSTVVGGGGTAVAVATGTRTEAGQIQLLVGEAHAPETPMQRQLDALGGQLAIVSSTVCAAVLVIGLFRSVGFLQMLKAAVALAVAAVPEGLPTLATTTLAIGVEQMRRREVLVRRLDAIETLAAVNVIAFDKTGTLTQNQMSAAAIICGGERYEASEAAIWHNNNAAIGSIADARPELVRLLKIIALCSEVRFRRRADCIAIAGTPTETALVRLAMAAGLDVPAVRRAMPLRGTEYRSQDRRYMVTIHDAPRGGTLLAVKGSPEQVLALCSWQLRGDRRFRLSAPARRRIGADNLAMAEGGLRVLGIAYAFDPEGQHQAPSASADRSSKRRFCWAGLIGLMDPVRHGAEDVLSQFDRAGVRVIMLTGDQASTAMAIARDLNLAKTGPLMVTEPDRLHDADDRTITELARRTHIFARITPADKLRIVRALQSNGDVVAMTGDGINDSPALRAADVGIVMGRSGAEAAREVADIVLRGDDLTAIATALKSGRVTYANVRKAIHFLLATNLSEILVVLTIAALGTGTLLAPIQLLWINLLSDVLPALGLALEPAEEDVLSQPPRDPHEPIIRPDDMLRLAREGGIIAAGSLAACGYGIMRHGASSRAGTICFTSLVGAQLLHALTCRSDRHGLFTAERLGPNRPLFATLLGSAVLQMALLAVPVLRRFMGLARLDFLDLLVGLAGAILPYIANEASKLRGAARGSDERAHQRRG